MSIYGVLSVLCLVLKIRISCFEQAVESVHNASIRIVARDVDRRGRCSSQELRQENAKLLLASSQDKSVLLKQNSKLQEQIAALERQVAERDRIFDGQGTSRHSSLTHNNRACAQLQRDAHVLRKELERPGKEFEHVLGSLLFVGIVLIVFPMIALRLNSSPESKHLCLRDVFCLSLGLLSIYLGLVETSSVSAACSNCLATLVDLHVVATDQAPTTDKGLLPSLA